MKFGTYMWGATGEQVPVLLKGKSTKCNLGSRIVIILKLHLSSLYYFSYLERKGGISGLGKFEISYKENHIWTC